MRIKDTVVRVPGGSASIHAIRLGSDYLQKVSHFGVIDRVPLSPNLSLPSEPQNGPGILAIVSNKDKTQSRGTTKPIVDPP